MFEEEFEMASMMIKEPEDHLVIQEPTHEDMEVEAPLDEDLLPALDVNGDADEVILPLHGEQLTEVTAGAEEDHPASVPARTDETDPLATKSNPVPKSPNGLAVIRPQPAQRLAVVNQALDLLAQSGNIFERHGSMVSVQMNGRSSDVVVRTVSPADLMLLLEDIAEWQRADQRHGGWVPMDVPQHVCSTLLRMSLAGKLPRLTAVAHQPFLRADGSLSGEPGYDSATGVYGAFLSKDFRAAPAFPSREDAAAAIELLNACVDEFPFVCPADRSASLAALLTAAVRSSLPTAPMIHIRAHVPGTGKSYLASVITALATDRVASPLSFPGSEDECEKLLLAELAAGAAVLDFDNLTGDIVPFKKLCTVLTSERVSGRVLRTSRTVDVSTRALILSSGNNVGPIGDMSRRCITINLDLRNGEPADRKFGRPELLREIREDRGRYVGAALTVIRAWIACGQPRVECRPLASFERWSDWCRQPLLWLGLDDPASSIYRAGRDDPDRQALGHLLTIWHARAGGQPMMVRDLIRLAASPAQGETEDGADHAMRDLLEDIAGSDAGTINLRKLGWWLKRQTGRMVGGLRLELVPRNLNALVWRVVKA